MHRTALVLLATLALVGPARAHNTAVAVAAPLPGIVVDGDLSDWPEDLQRFPVARAEFATPPADEADLLAWFRVAFDPDGRYLYVAVEVLDESLVVVDSSSTWNASDGAEVFLDLRHDLATAACVQHVVYGVHHRSYRAGVDSVAADSGLATWAVDRGGGRHRYEWRFDATAMAGGGLRLAPGMALGLDVAVTDRDADGSFSWVAWGTGTGKLGTANRLGDLALVGAAGAAQLWGTVRWAGDGQGPPPRRLRLRERRAPERMWLEVAADRQGRWEVELAPGDYEVTPVDLRVRRDTTPLRRVEARAGQRRQAPDLAVPPVPDRAVLVDQLFADLQPGQPGAAVLVARHGQVLHAKGYGLANVELGVPITTRTKFRIASVSKQFTAAAVMLLVEAGQVDLDAPLSTYLPDYSHAARLTTRQLLAHTAGIPNYLGMASFWERAAVGTDLAGLLAVFQDEDLDFEPGTRYSYSNSGFVVLAHLLETRSGQTYEAFLRERLFAPLDMADTGVDHYRQVLPDRAAGYALGSAGELVNTLWLDMGLLVGAGNLYATVGDLLKWDQALYGDLPLRPESVRQMGTPQRLADGNDIDYGLGLRVAREHGLLTVGHAGNISGFTSQLDRYPEEGFTVIVLDNSPWIAPGEVTRQIAEIYLADKMVWEVAAAP